MRHQRITISIDGLMSTTGAREVSEAIAKNPGIQLAFVSTSTEAAYIVFDPSLTNLGTIVNTITGLGFQVGTMSNRSPSADLLTT